MRSGKLSIQHLEKHGGDGGSRDTRLCGRVGAAGEVTAWASGGGRGGQDVEAAAASSTSLLPARRRDLAARRRVGAAAVGWPGEAAAAPSTTSLPGGVSLSPVPSLPPGPCRANKTRF